MAHILRAKLDVRRFDPSRLDLSLIDFREHPLRDIDPDSCVD